MFFIFLSLYEFFLTTAVIGRGQRFDITTYVSSRWRESAEAKELFKHLLVFVCPFEENKCFREKILKLNSASGQLQISPRTKFVGSSAEHCFQAASRLHLVNV